MHLSMIIMLSNKPPDIYGTQTDSIHLRADEEFLLHPWAYRRRESVGSVQNTDLDDVISSDITAVPWRPQSIDLLFVSVP